MSHLPHQHRVVDPHPLVGFIDRYGWRAYALPVLTLLTLIALFRSGGGHNQADAAGHRAATAAQTSGPVSGSHPGSNTGANIGANTGSSAAAAGTPGPTRTIALPADPGQTAAPHATRSATVGTPTPCSSNTSARRVIVSIGSQHAWMCAKSTVVFSTAVTTGAVDKGHATPTGTFHIQGNQKGATLTGADYAVHVQYWIQFNGDIGFHDASWQTMKFGTAQYRTQGSLGCVHMPLPSITWLHKWVQIGQTVVTVTKT